MKKHLKMFTKTFFEACLETLSEIETDHKKDYSWFDSEQKTRINCKGEPAMGYEGKNDPKNGQYWLDDE